MKMQKKIPKMISFMTRRNNDGRGINGAGEARKTEENIHADMPNVDELLKLLQAQGMGAETRKKEMAL